MAPSSLASWTTTVMTRLQIEYLIFDYFNTIFYLDASFLIS